MRIAKRFPSLHAMPPSVSTCFYWRRLKDCAKGAKKHEWRCAKSTISPPLPVHLRYSTTTFHLFLTKSYQKPSQRTKERRLSETKLLAFLFLSPSISKNTAHFKGTWILEMKHMLNPLLPTLATRHTFSTIQSGAEKQINNKPLSRRERKDNTSLSQSGERKRRQNSSRHLCLGVNIDDIHLLHNNR